MSFKDLSLKGRYDSESDNLVDDFYIPVLSESTEYYRAVGFFRSSSLSRLAVGLKGLVSNNGKMKLVCGSVLSEKDVEAIIKGEKLKEEIIANNFRNDLDSIDDSFTKSGIEILAWMVANDLLEIKVAISVDNEGNPIFGKELHYKIGIFKDGSNYLSINGSNNESATGLEGNWEFFDVFKAWVPGTAEHFQGHVNLFNRTWNGETNNYEIISIPEATKRDLILRAPDFDNLDFDLVDYIARENQKRGVMTISAEPKKELLKRPTLFDYQIEARDSWLRDGKRGIFTMATGTGKTYTSLGCLEYVLDHEENLVTIIVAPYMHLLKQWKDSIVSFGISDRFDQIIVVDSSNPRGKSEFQEAVFNIDLGIMDTALILTTHDSFWRPNFTDFIKDDDFDCHFFIIGDEMHGLGSYNRQRGLLSEYDYRLGLSATPTRHFDELGTQALVDYFGKESYVFPLKKAVTEINERTRKTYLTPFKYKVYTANLDLTELTEYNDLTFNIRVECAKKNRNKNTLEKYLRDRADILKNANEKYDVLREMLDDLKEKGPEYTSNLLVYVSNKQINKVVHILGNEYGLSVKTFTSEDCAIPDITGKSKREEILEDFASGTYDVLVAMKCLDEGVDVPSATNAILMCNSTNSREFIQRIGRVIRQYEGKTFAHVYDIGIKPSGFYPKYKYLEEKIHEKEKIRIKMISDVAFNNDYLIK